MFRHIPILAVATLLLSACGMALPRPDETAAQNEVPMQEEGSVQTLARPETLPPLPQTSRQPQADDAVVEGPTVEQQAVLDRLRQWGPAPEIANEVWINSEPLKLADLRGKVVLVEFWTFGCYNCRNVLPAMRDWYAKYADEGFEIVAIHTPEFSYEKELTNVQASVGELGVTWPVAIDNDWKSWRLYNNHYWPAMYFVDKAGNLRYLKIGEGQYEQTEEIIQALLAERL